MRTTWLVVMVAILGMGTPAAWSDGGLLIEAGTDITFGKFTYKDATVEVTEEFFNPNLMLEYVFPDRLYGIGVRYAMSENGFTLDYADNKKKLVGNMDAERTILLPYLRIGPHDGVFFRIGAIFYEYEFSNATLDETRNGVPTKRIRDGYAKGELTPGLDAEISMLFGKKVQLGLHIGGAFYPGAKYTWRYRDELKGGALVTGNAKLDAATVRGGPELSVAVGKNWRLFARYAISATSWLGNEDEEHEDYAGTDIMTSVLVGLRADMGW
ncbi:MAG TPA: hypothetical protein PKE26_00620 [Kiritimatiellia bacterium]|nr:hypothetical protein [Kiritimatiellia bacterium]HMO97596.1 hypothetical protein [Kiritimatiellia bacterium]HMP98081.1 hypothetical protein [Kiritimatiellia bacterium]